MTTLDLRGSSGTLRLSPNGGTGSVRSFMVVGQPGPPGANGAPGPQGVPGPAIASDQIAALSATFAPIVGIGQFVQAGETLVSDGSTAGNNTAIIQRAVDALNGLYATDGRPRKLFFPDGGYRLTKQGNENGDATHPYAIRWRSGVGIATSSRRGVTFYAPADATPFMAAYTFGNLTDVYCDPHVVDGAAQTNVAYFTGLKGWFVQDLNRFSFTDILIKNTWATGFGCDFLRAGKVTGYADGCGRGLGATGTDPLTTSGGSGFGIGTGKYATEDFELDVVATNNGFHGVFTETQTGQPNAYSKGSRIRARVSGNYVGFRDCGSDGLLADIVAENNTYADILHDGTFLSPTAGINGRVRCQLLGATGKGIVVGKADAGRYTWQGTCRNHAGEGVLFKSSASVAPGLTFDLECDKNAASGYVIQSPSTIKSLAITGSARNNGQSAGSTYRDGVTVLTATDLLDISARCVDDQATPTQQVGIALRTAGVTLSRARLRADARGNVTPTFLQQTISTDSVLVIDGADTSGPSTLVATPGDGQVVLAWSPPIPAGDVTDYAIQYRTGGGAWSTFAHTASTATTRTITGLSNGTTYEFQVAKVTATGTGSYTAGPVAATPVAAPLFSDTFVRADNGATLGTTDGGTGAAQTWLYSPATTWKIQSNFARAASGGTSVARINCGADGTHTARFGALKAGFSTRVSDLVFRYTDESNYWVAQPHNGSATGNWSLVKKIAGTNTTVSDSGVLAADGDTVKVVCNGSSIKMYVNGTLAATAIDSALSTATFGGLRGSFTGDATGKFGYADATKPGWAYSTQTV